MITRDAGIFVGLFAAGLAGNLILWLIAIWVLEALGLLAMAPAVELELGTYGPTGHRSGV
ncbi:MAG: hypothetical protein ABI725_10310 [Chloroflexota bacterium]